jgi:hypothetical protein
VHGKLETHSGIGLRCAVKLGVAKRVIFMVNRLIDAHIRASIANNDLLKLWSKYVPTHEECVKDIIKYAIRDAVVYLLLHGR